MTELIRSLQAYPDNNFAKILKSEISELEKGKLPLYLGTTQGGIVDDSNISVTVINHCADENTIQAKIGVFFNEIIGGCSCGDDPLSENVYCELQVAIDRKNAQASFQIIQD